MKDNDKHGFGTFGAIVLGVTAVATAIVAVSKSKKKKQGFNSFLKDELVKLPLFSKDESHHVKKHVADEDDIFVDEDNDTQDDKATSFYDEEISYEEDEEFQSVSKAKPIVDFKPKHDAPQKPAEETEDVQEKAEEEVEATDGQQDETVKTAESATEQAEESAEVSDEQQEKVAEQAEAADEVKQDETVETAEESVEVSDEQPERVVEETETVQPETEASEQTEPVEETVQTQPEASEQAEEQPEVVAEQEEPVHEDNFESVGNTSTLASGDGTDEVFEEEEEPAIDTEKQPEAVEEPDDAFVFESVVVGREAVKDEPVDISDKKLDREFIAEPVDAEPARDNFVLNDEDVSEEVQEIEIDDVTTEPAEEKVAEPEKEESSVSSEKYDDVSSEAETAKEDIAAAVETPVRETFSEVEFFEDDDIEEGLRSNESYYDWTYNVDEHYSVITDGTWVYCKSDDVLTSDSVNKKGERETIDIADTFKNRIKTKGYCLLKYIGTDREVIVPDTINGKPVVAALNTFRSNQIVKKVILPSTMQGLRRTFYSCYHLDSITFAPGTNLVYELDAIMCGNNDMDSNTEATTVYCSRATAEYIKGHYRLGCPVIFVEK